MTGSLLHHVRRSATALCVAFVVLVCARASYGWQPEDAERYDGMLVAEVRLEGIRSEADLRRTEPHIHTKSGQPLDAATITEDLYRLGRLGMYEAVDAAVIPLDLQRVSVVFTFEPNPIILDVEVAGNERIETSEIASEVEILAGTQVDRYILERTARRIERLYRDRGFYRARVSIDWEYLEETDRVLFRVDEGDRVKVTRIRFEGNENIETRFLRAEIDTKTAGLLEKGPLDMDQIERDVAAIIRYYKNRGYLDVRADRDPVRFSPDGREAIVTFRVAEGPRYTLRSVRAVLADEGGRASDRPPTVFSQEQIAGLMRVKPGDIYAQGEVERSVQSVRDAYAKLGYVFDRGLTQKGDSRIRRRELREPGIPVVDLLLVITEGQRYKMGLPKIVGNDLTQGKVVLREMGLKPGMPLDGTRLDLTDRRLRALNLFRPGSVRLTMLPPDDVDPQYRDLLIEVEETNTGAVSFGAAVNSDAGLAGFISITQRNFDIADVPDSLDEFLFGRAFRGAGQTLTIEASPGTEIQNYAISLQEPHLFETNYSGSIAGSFRQREFSEYDEDRLSASLGLGRRLGTRWVWNSTLRVEQVDIHNIDADAPTDVFDNEGQDVLTGLGFSLTRTTRDPGPRPSRGVRTVLGVEQVGVFGGEFNFTKLNASHSVILPLYEDYLGRFTTLSLRAGASWIPQGNDEVPVYERFYLGGRTLRGFRFRTISPKGIRNDTMEESNDPIGGSWSFSTGAELEHPIVDQALTGVLFLDAGTVTDEIGFDDMRLSGGFGVRLYIGALSPVPLAFDFGFPIFREDGDEERVFSFSFDIPLR